MKPDAFQVRYDRGSDVLYVSVARHSGAYGEEGDAPGLVWRYRDEDDALVGVTVMDYQAYWKPRFPMLLEEFASHFHMPPAWLAKEMEGANL